MFISKLAATGVLFSGSYQVSRSQNRFRRAECEGNAAAEQGVTDLDKIFAGQEGGLPPDAEEIQEMIMKAQGKTIRQVYNKYLIAYLTYLILGNPLNSRDY